MFLTGTTVLDVLELAGAGARASHMSSRENLETMKENCVVHLPDKKLDLANQKV